VSRYTYRFPSAPIVQPLTGITMHWHSEDTGLKTRSEAPWADGVSLSPFEPNVMFGSREVKLNRRWVSSTGSRSSTFLASIGLSAAKIGVDHERHTMAVRASVTCFMLLVPLAGCESPAVSSAANAGARQPSTMPEKMDSRT